MTVSTRAIADKASAVQRDRRLAIFLLAAMSLLIGWKFMAEWSRRPFDPFTLTAADFLAFNPASGQWRAERVSVPATPIEPNLAAFRMARRSADDPYPPAFVRLAQGYNMPDCMRIKGYQVELLSDGSVPEAGGRVQIWRLTDPLGDESVWVSSLLRAEDYAVLDRDIRALPFPRIGVPDDPDWAPTGLRWRSFRRPIRNMRWYFRARWNNARGDWLTFLRLKRPAWASDDILALVSTLSGSPVFPRVEEPAVREKILAAHNQVRRALAKSH